MLRSFLIGCVQSSQVALDTLIKLPEVELVGVYTAKKQGINSDFFDITTHPRLGNTPIYFAEEVNHVDLYKIENPSSRCLMGDRLVKVDSRKTALSTASCCAWLPSCSTSEK